MIKQKPRTVYLQPTSAIHRRILFLWNRIEEMRAKYHNTQHETQLQFFKDLDAYNESVLSYHLACERYGVRATWLEWDDVA